VVPVPDGVETVVVTDANGSERSAKGRSLDVPGRFVDRCDRPRRGWHDEPFADGRRRPRERRRGDDGSFSLVRTEAGTLRSIGVDRCSPGATVTDLAVTVRSDRSVGDAVTCREV
jgi:hypothetical protein